MGAFIVGLIIGIFFGSFTYGNKDEKNLFYGGIIVGVITTILISANIENGYLVSVGAVVAWAIVFYYEGKQDSTRKKKDYRSHCWKCNSSINSQYNNRCPKCGWYICSDCGACGCDYPHK